MAKNPKITEFLKETLEMRWSEFSTMEKNADEYSSNNAVVFSLIRSCAKGKLPAIKEALNRIDGKIAIEIEVEYPKFYFRYPYATKITETTSVNQNKNRTEPIHNENTPAIVEPEAPMPLGSLRATLERMSDQPRSLVKIIIDAAVEIDMAVNSDQPTNPGNDPLVKSVVIAGLLNMAHKGNLGAVFEVLDQIDGKVADKIKVLGQDVYINVYSKVAPQGAIKGEDGIYQIQSDNTTNSWAASLERGRSKGDSYDSRF